jgi:hypothetical protein
MPGSSFYYSLWNSAGSELPLSPWPFERLFSRPASLGKRRSTEHGIKLGVYLVALRDELAGAGDLIFV